MQLSQNYIAVLCATAIFYTLQNRTIPNLSYFSSCPNKMIKVNRYLSFYKDGDQMQKEMVLSHHNLAGLNHAEVERSRNRYGSNIITKKKKKSFLWQYFASFGDPIIRILMIALAVNVIFMFRNSGWYESAGIAVAVILATLVSTLSEYGSESTFEKLQQQAGEINCRVRRNNSLFLLPVQDLVVGDIVLLQGGERIPSDGHMISGELSVDQSALNGETKEVNKYPDENLSNKTIDLMSHSGIFQGSVVCEGEGAMQVDCVGDRTFYGKMAVEVQEDTIESPLKQRLAKLAKTISRLGYTAAIIVGIANLFNAFIIDSRFNTAAILGKLTDFHFAFGTLINTLMLTITVIVMAVPEGLPMMITVVLSANMKKMLKDNVLVRKLVGIETAGSLNILFTDKTGTLTKGKLQVTSFITGDGKQFDSFSMLKKYPDFMKDVVTACALNTDSAISGVKQKTVIGGNGTDKAMLTYVLPFIDRSKNAKLISHQPFNSKNKFLSSEIMQNGMKKILIKGAPELILPRCKFYLSTDGSKKVFDRQNLAVKMKEMTEKAMRILALAQSDSENGTFILIGIVGIRDEVRPQAKKAVAEILGAGIQTVMITGDNKETAVAIAKEIGLIKNQESSVFTSQELAHMSDTEIKKVLRNIRVVARALPSDKSRLVSIAQQARLVAGMTGDGINDAPALKKADVGFAMGSGTEVAKEAGDIVIIDNNIGSIAKAVLYGRTIFKSIRKFIVFQLTMNLCAVGLSVICPFLGIDAPLIVMQMLWVNMIMDTLAGLAFSGEAPLRDYMKEPPKKRDEDIINRYMYSEILFTGIYSIFICLIFLKLPLIQNIFHFNDGSHYYMTAFFALFIFLGVFNSLNTRTYRMNLFSHILRNKLFIFVLILICVVQIFLIYFGGTVFRTHGIDIQHLNLILLIAATVIPADLIRKALIRSVGRKGHI